MGKDRFGIRQTRPQTPAELHAYAKELEAVAGTLHKVADRMLIKGVSSIVIRYAPGAHAELLNTLKPFALDAEKKAAKRGA